MSAVYKVGTPWKGFPAIRYLIILFVVQLHARTYPYSRVRTSGASYCDVGYASIRQSDRSPPSAAEPLGIKFPGITYAEEGLPNWVGHLITKYSPPPRFDPSLGEEQDPRYKESPLLVYNYSIGGQTVDGVRSQVEAMFLPSLGRDFGKSWNDTNSLFITFVGINDCGKYANPDDAHKTLFATQETLYKAGARNFLLIDVPPIHRSPAVRKDYQEESSEIYLKWNEVLRGALEKFSEAHKDATVFLFSSFELFTKVLDSKPEEYGFPKDDRRKAGGSIWLDMIHPTSKVHDIFASNLANFLNEQ